MSTPPNRGVAVGIVLLVVANGLTATVDAGAKLLGTQLHSSQIVWGYCVGIGAFLVAFALARPTPLRETLATRELSMQLARPAMLVLAISTLFLAFNYMPLADAAAIALTAPLFITALSVPLLGERVGAHRWAAVVVGLIGAAIVVRPGTDAFHWAALIVLASALSFALFQLMTRRLAATESTFTTLFYTGIGAMLWSSLVVPFVWRPLEPVHALWFAALGLLGVGAHLSMIKAFEMAQASLLAPFNYVKLLWAALLGYALFGDVPGPAVIVGATVIAASGTYVILRERRIASETARANTGRTNASGPVG